jgi:NAD(P)-dependent dehydrogenase (short-subunit alcohol dehydrogenase family)
VQILSTFLPDLSRKFGLKVGWLQPDDISPAAVFLASDAAAMVTGAEYQVTGGDSAKDV